MYVCGEWIAFTTLQCTKLVLVVARESSAEGRVVVAYDVDDLFHDLFHVVPFSQAQRDPLACRLNIRLTVRKKKFTHIDAIEA